MTGEQMLKLVLAYRVSRVMKSHDLHQRIEKALSKITITDGLDIVNVLEGQNIGIYCRNFVSYGLESLIISMLGKCKKFDLRCREQKPLMAKARRRLVLGASEVANQIELEKVKSVIVATDVEDDSLLDSDFKECVTNFNVNVIYCCTRKQLSTLLLAPSANVSVVGIRHFDGVEEDWKQAQNIVAKLRADWLESMITAKDYVNRFGQSLTWMCAYYGHHEVLGRIGDKLGNIDFVNPSDGSSPLMVAVRRDHDLVVRIILSLNADQYIPDFRLNLPLHNAQSAIVAEMLDYHEKKNASSFTAIECSVINGNIPVAATLLKKSQNVSFSNLLFLSCQCKNPKMIQFLISEAAYTPDHLLILKDKHENNLLMKTVLINNYELFKFIGSYLGWTKIDCKQTNSDGDDIFSLSRENRNIGIQRKLEKIYKESKLL